MFKLNARLLRSRQRVTGWPPIGRTPQKVTRSRSTSFVDSNLGLLRSAMRNGKIEAILVGDEQRGAGTCRRSNTSDSREAIAILILKYVDISFAATHIQTPMRRIVEN